MACSSEFIDFVCSQIADAGMVRAKKMFGDYCIYVDEKPTLFVCDNIVYSPPAVKVSAPVAS